MSGNVIISNQVKCLKCGDAPYSAHRHHYSSCECGAIAVDGGQEYLRRVGDWEKMEELSITLPEKDVTSLIVTVEEALASGRNAFGVVCALLREMRDLGLLKGLPCE